jgi:hypothetical protein
VRITRITDTESLQCRVHHHPQLFELDDLTRKMRKIPVNFFNIPGEMILAAVAAHDEIAAPAKVRNGCPHLAIRAAGQTCQFSLSDRS